MNLHRSLLTIAMRRWRKAVSLLLLTMVQYAVADSTIWYDGSHKLDFGLGSKSDPVVKVALTMFQTDMKSVTDVMPTSAKYDKARIKVVQLDKCGNSTIKQLAKIGIPTDSLLLLTDGFAIKEHQGYIYVAGTNGRGTAYGILQLSRMAGVSPWIWWGDVVPKKKQKLTIPTDYLQVEGASVEWRGIFINDEDWSLRPWSYGNYEPNEFGMIGPKTYRKVFELLLRLRANAIWPAMHTGTRAFFLTPGAKEMADSCGIAIGTSHCEPLLRNNLEEWNVKERGAFNYIINKDAVTDYWTQRLKEVKNSAGGNMFTIGMRGIHDGSMEGVKTMKEKFDALQQVIDDQQQLIKKYIGDPAKQMQVFVPYKEVLEIYERGLKVPDYATLMWCDDNYGYMTRLSNKEEQKRKGGGGVYYHLSYWGRPHDYLWLTTTQPGLIYNEMKAAYDHNVRKLWIVNVHDPKVAGYDLELFLDMAWNINSVSASTIDNHYRNWLCTQFGNEVGNDIFPAMYDFYRLVGQRHPEFMGWSQTELSKATYDRGLSQIRNTQFSSTAFGDELDRYLSNFADICKKVENAKLKLRPELQDAYYASILYPVLSASANATKHLEAQKARQLANGSTNDDMFKSQDKLYTSVAKSQDAYQQIRRMTEYYNKKMAHGKWNRSMNMRPRDLPVHGAPVLPTLLNDQEVKQYLSKNTSQSTFELKLDKGTIACNAYKWKKASDGATVVKMLGHSMNAVALPKDGELMYEFTSDEEGMAELRIALIPTQPNDKGDLRFCVAVDGGTPTIFSLKEKFRSEGWKQNVLRGQAVKTLNIDNLSKGYHTITIKALDPHIVVDQWMIDYNIGRKFYLFPVSD